MPEIDVGVAVAARERQRHPEAVQGEFNDRPCVSPPFLGPQFHANGYARGNTLRSACHQAERGARFRLGALLELFRAFQRLHQHCTQGLILPRAQVTTH